MMTSRYEAPKSATQEIVAASLGRFRGLGFMRVATCGWNTSQPLQFVMLMYINTLLHFFRNFLYPRNA